MLKLLLFATCRYEFVGIYEIEIFNLKISQTGSWSDVIFHGTKSHAIGGRRNT
jgi:hypothetical protein